MDMRSKITDGLERVLVENHHLLRDIESDIETMSKALPRLRELMEEALAVWTGDMAAISDILSVLMQLQHH